MQLVVQLAQEMTRGRPCALFTPCTTVGTLSDFVGADRITYEEVREIVDVGEVIDRHEVEPLGIEQDLQGGPADPPETIDGHIGHLT